MRLHVVCAFLFLCASSVGSAACVGHAQDAHEPGDRLGTFHATGTLGDEVFRVVLTDILPLVLLAAFVVYGLRAGDGADADLGSAPGAEGAVTPGVLGN